MNYPKPDPDAPLGSPQHPIHASTLARIVDATDYTPPGGGVWAKTVAGTAFHQRQADVCNGAPYRTAAQYLDAALAEERGPIAWGRHTHETLAREIEAWSRAIDLVHRPSARTACKAEVAFRFHDESTGLWYEGELDEVQFVGTNKQITGVGVTDYKTGEKAPDTRLHPQHHLYCLGVLYGVLSIGVPYHAEAHLLDWSGETGDPWRLNLWPQAFRYFHLPSLLARGSWNMLALATDGSLMSEPNSREYLRKLTKQLLDAQPQRVAVAVTAQPTIETETETMGNPQPQAKNLASALSSAMRDVRGVAPDKRNDFHKYSYTSAEAILSEARHALAANGLSIFPKRLTVKVGGVEKVTKKDGREEVIQYGIISRQFELIHDSGESRITDEIEMPWQTESGRPADKAIAAADTASLKYFVRSLLMMPRTEDDEVDSRDDRNHEPRQFSPAPSQPAAPAFSWGEPRGEGFASDAQIKRLRANCDTLGFSLAKVIKTATSIGAASDLTSVADLPAALIVRLILKTEELLKKAEAPRPEREKTAAELLEDQVRQIVGPEIRTKRAKELAEIIRSGPLAVNQIIEIMENEAAPDTQFTALPEAQQEQLLHTIKRAADSAASRAMAGATNGNGSH